MGKGFRYYFQHPWSRLVVAYLVIFFNFLIFAEDPVSHSQTEANVIVVGNCFSFLTNKYPEGGGWRFLKVLLWLLAILTGLIAGKFLFHQRLFDTGQLAVHTRVWICGHSIVFWVHRHTSRLPKGSQLGFGGKAALLSWHAWRGMLWDQLIPLLYAVRVHHRPLDIFVIYL